MVIRYVHYGVVRVSARWRTVLRAADRAGVKFTVTSGYRTIPEQWRLFRQNMHWTGIRWAQRIDPVTGRLRPLTAFPSPLAPHNRKGRHAHAIDVNSLDGGETRLERWVESQGADWKNTVAGESWHGELSGGDLRRLARKIRREERAKAAAKRKARREKARQKAREARRRRSKATHASPQGIEFLVREEGLVPHAYEDSEGHATFGVGHLIHLGPLTAIDRAQWGTKEHPKTRAFALQVFRNDLKSYEATVREAVHVPLEGHEFDALVSLCFNIGRAGFRSSTVVRLLNAGLRLNAADAFLLWSKPAVLKPRRERERTLFLKGH